MTDVYHHGNLRQALIDAGIKIINESGEDGLSLRKVAASCGVSHAAPYAHFKDKEALLEAIKRTVTDSFAADLKGACEGCSNADEALIAIGRAYISFFRRNPDYYTFLFGRQNITAHLQMNESHEEDYPPFLLFKDCYKKHLAENGLEKTEKEQETEILKIWAIVHGMASIACMKGVSTSIDWDDPDNGLVV